MDAYDKELLDSNSGLGDVASIGRHVEFRFVADNKATSDLACRIITDLGYGVPKAKKHGAEYEVLVTVHMPLTSEVLACVSAFMVFFAELLAMEYDGWEADICR